MSDEQRRQPEVIRVSVSSDEMRKLIDQNNALLEEKKTMTQKLEDAEKNGQLFDTMKSRIAESYTAQGLPVPKIEDVNDFNNAVELLKATQKKGSQSQNFVPSGTVPLDTQGSQNSNTQAWGSMEEMIDSVRDLASSENPDKVSRAENQKILDALMVKSLKGQKEGKQDMVYQQPKDVSLSDILNEKYRRRKALRGK